MYCDQVIELLVIYCKKVVSIIFRKFRNAIGNESNQPVLFCSLISSFSSSNRCCMLRYRLAPQSVPET